MCVNICLSVVHDRVVSLNRRIQRKVVCAAGEIGKAVSHSRVYILRYGYLMVFTTQKISLYLHFQITYFKENYEMQIVN